MLVLGLSLAGLTVVLSTFHFFLDDYGFFIRTVLFPWQPDLQLRWLSVTARFSALLAVGSPEWAFALSNVIALAGTCTFFGLLLFRAGASKRVAFLAAVLVSMGAGVHQMVRWASGFEHLSAHFFLLLATLTVDFAYRGGPPPTRRLGGLLLASAVAAVGVFTKGKVLVLVPPVAGLWLRACVPRSRLRDAIVVALTLALAMAPTSTATTASGQNTRATPGSTPSWTRPEGWTSPTWSSCVPATSRRYARSPSTSGS
jgi:hypothetical protein